MLHVTTALLSLWLALYVRMYNVNCWCKSGKIDAYVVSLYTKYEIRMLFFACCVYYVLTLSLCLSSRTYNSSLFFFYIKQIVSHAWMYLCKVKYPIQQRSRKSDLIVAVALSLLLWRHDLIFVVLLYDFGKTVVVISLAFFVVYLRFVSV